MHKIEYSNPSCLQNLPSALQIGIAFDIPSIPPDCEIETGCFDSNLFGDGVIRERRIVSFYPIKSPNMSAESS